MDGWVRVLRPFSSISVISRRWKGEHERLCAMKRRLGSGRISPPAGFEPATPWSEVGSANRSATRTLPKGKLAYYLSRFVTKPTMWLCARRRLRSAWASAQSDQSSLSAWRLLGSLATHWAHSEDCDQTGRMPRLIWVFARRSLTLLVLSRGGSFVVSWRQNHEN